MKAAAIDVLLKGIVSKLHKKYQHNSMKFSQQFFINYEIFTERQWKSKNCVGHERPNPPFLISNAYVIPFPYSYIS